MTETRSGADGSASADNARLDDHERRITALEQGVVSIQLKLVEVQTEGRMRGERQDRDTAELKRMTGKVKDSVDDLLGGISFLKAAFKWSWGVFVGIAAFIAMYGDALLIFWRHMHQ